MVKDLSHVTQFNITLHVLEETKKAPSTRKKDTHCYWIMVLTDVGWVHALAGKNCKLGFWLLRTGIRSGF
jgi:hypothetical protein